jgi:ADP-ribose pyrophosphatase
MDDAKQVVELEVVEDLTARARLDEGFLRLKRLRCRNRRTDGSFSEEYAVDVVDRPTLDAVAVLVYRHTSKGVEVLTRDVLRPAAYFRPKTRPGADRQLHLTEVVAGTLEPEDQGEEGVRVRAAAEVREEAGIEVGTGEIRLLGAPVYLTPGVLSEKIYFASVDVTGKHEGLAEGDGSPLEEDARLRWWKVPALLAACRTGEVADAKTELALTRFLSGVRPPGEMPPVS